MTLPTIKVYLLTVVLPDITKKLWNDKLDEKYTYYLARAGTQWRGLNLQALKCFPIQGHEIFRINTSVNLDEPAAIPEEILDGYLTGKDTLSAVSEKLENYLNTIAKFTAVNTSMLEENDKSLELKEQDKGSELAAVSKKNTNKKLPKNKVHTDGSN